MKIENLESKSQAGLGNVSHLLQGVMAVSRVLVNYISAVTGASQSLLCPLTFALQPMETDVTMLWVVLPGLGAKHSLPLLREHYHASLPEGFDKAREHQFR